MAMTILVLIQKKSSKKSNSKICKDKNTRYQIYTTKIPDTKFTQQKYQIPNLHNKNTRYQIYTTKIDVHEKK
jgi:hypothetical protein